MLSDREASGFRLSELGFIRQSFDLMPGVSALDNATLKLLKAKRWAQARREIAPLLERLGLGDRMGHRSETLSMGERQRVMIAQLSRPDHACCSQMSRRGASTAVARAKCSSSYAISAASARSRR